MRSFLLSIVFVAFAMAAAEPMDNEPIKLTVRGPPAPGVPLNVPNCQMNSRYAQEYRGCTSSKCGGAPNPAPGTPPIACFLECHSLACQRS
ncbi:hypothetical protein BC940DRAFT_287347 [Gongronella butleri]|nr:hypothetical protein BC940DRAFT_287347 [Gongronella butleri]